MNQLVNVTSDFLRYHPTLTIGKLQPVPGNVPQSGMLLVDFQFQSKRLFVGLEADDSWKPIGIPHPMNVIGWKLSPVVFYH